jgi:inhibitor of KinA sporulation pathway (predicted exonuclease)
VDDARWRKVCQDAFFETDIDKLRQKVLAAENVVMARLLEWRGQSGHGTERQALSDALTTIRKILVEKLKYPKVEGE